MVGEPSELIAVLAYNRGPGDVTLGVVGLAGAHPGDFVLGALRCDSARLIPNAFCAIDVSFRPRASGPRSALLIFTDAAMRHSLSVPLTGIGTTAQGQPRLAG
jgi:hypothetical protein